MIGNTPFYFHYQIFSSLIFVFENSVQQELIRTVDLGPFKHIVDDGLELRKAAFECVDTLLDSCLDQVNPSSFIVPYLRSGLDGECLNTFTSYILFTYRFSSISGFERF